MKNDEHNSDILMAASVFLIFVVAVCIAAGLCWWAGVPLHQTPLIH